MKEITDEALSAIRSNLSACNPLVQSLVVRLDRVEEENQRLCPTCHGHGDITVSSGQTPESYYVENIECPDCVGVIRVDDRAEIAALRERIKRMEEALTMYGEHKASCPAALFADAECVCGLRAALKEGE